MPVAVGVLAAVSLLAPFAPVYDPWAWLVWGREIAGLDLHTGAGPSWKPLPALVATILAPAGEAAPALWLLIARAGWLAAVGLAYHLAWRLMFPIRVSTGLAVRFAPRRVRLARNLAGLIAALGVILLFDPFTSWTRQFAGGLSEPLLVALVLGAVDRGLSRRHGQALALGFAAALLRPEAWPLLLAYGGHLWLREPGLRRWLIAVALALPVLWLVPDLIGSGSALTGAERAREGTGAVLHEAFESLGRSLALPQVALWGGSVVAVVTAWQHREREILVLAAGAAAWIAIVALLAGAGYAGLPRFAAPAAAVACVLGGIGIVRLVAAIDGMRLVDRRRPAAIALAGTLLAGLALQGVVRAAEIPGEIERAADYGEQVDGLTGLVDDLGRDHLVACEPVASTDFLTETALAWKLELPIEAIQVRTETAPATGTAFVLAGGRSPAAEAIDGSGTKIAELGEWSAYEISCGPAVSAASGRAIAGVAGAARYGGSSTSPSSR